MSCLVPSTALRCKLSCAYTYILADDVGCRSSVPLIRQCSNPYRFTTSSTGSASNHPSSSHPKRNPHISNDPRYSVIQNTVEHDAQNWLYPWAISDEMKRSGIASSESLNYLLFVSKTIFYVCIVLSRCLQSLRHSDMQQSWRVLEEMKRLKVPISKDNLSQLITRAVHNNNLELSLRYLKTLRSQTPPLDIPPEPIQCIIELAARQNHARLAIDVASWWDESGGSPLPKSVWTLCLASAASELYVSRTPPISCHFAAHGIFH